MTLRMFSTLALVCGLPIAAAAQVGVISTGNGSATLPSHSFTSDTNTGLYRVGADDIGVTTGGTLRLDIDTARVLSTLPVRPSTSTLDLGSNTLKWQDFYGRAAIIGNEATQINNAALFHVDGSQPNGLLALGLGDFSALGDLQLKRISIGTQADNTFAVGRGYSVAFEENYSAADPATNLDFLHGVFETTPTADVTKSITGIAGNLSLRGTHNYTGSANDYAGLYGAAYPGLNGSTTSNFAGNVAGVIGDAEHASTGTAAQVWAIDAAYCCAYDPSGAHGTVARAGFFRARQPFKGTGTITHHDGIWIDDQTAGSSYTASTLHSLHITNATGSDTIIGTDGQVLATSYKLAPNGVSKPSCNSGNRGLTWYVPGGAGVADTYEVCRKDAADSYAWATLF